MDKIMVSTFLCNTLIVLFCVILVLLAIGMIQTMINDHRREKREQDSAARELEYHEQRMKDLLSRN